MRPVRLPSLRPYIRTFCTSPGRHKYRDFATGAVATTSTRPINTNTTSTPTLRTTRAMSSQAEHSTATSSRQKNRLVDAKSPYLLQHADNPVDWYEWGTEAFEEARREDKPIFLSTGTPPGCHVLAHESFEDELTAKLMNENYVNIKVDREERPDVDQLYMTYLQATKGGGGWPMSVWLTPELHPFFAGTYFPKGQFRGVLLKLAEVWESDPERCKKAGRNVIEQLRQSSNIASGDGDITLSPLADSVYSRLEKRYDERFGGFGSAPKFPQPSQTLHFLARYAALNLRDPAEAKRTEAEHAREMGVESLVKIYEGGIHDFVGGGFARYSVDERWHVPHFEKMLYDQGQLLSSALEFAQIVPRTSPQRATLLSMAADIVQYVARDLRASGGGFFSAEDADSLPTNESPVKKEGAFYTWTAAQLQEVLGREIADPFGHYFGVEEDGNCDPSHDIQGELRGQNVLYVAHTVEDTAKMFGRPVEETKELIHNCLVKLKEYRDKHRPRPHLDDKILTSWNGLMISGLSRAAEVFEEETEGKRALQLAEESAVFIRKNLYNESTGELRRSYREGPGPTGQADDYAFLIQGLLDLYEASGNEEYALWAIRLQEKEDELFYDAEGGGYFSSAPDPHILVRMKEAQDGAEPSAASVTLSNLQRLAHLAEDRHAEYHEKAKSVRAANAQVLTAAPFALATMISAGVMAEKGYKQLIVSGLGPQGTTVSPFLKVIRSQFVPNRVLIHLDPEHPPKGLAEVNATLRSLAQDTSKLAEEGPSVRICQNFTCGLPIKSVEELEKVLD